MMIRRVIASVVLALSMAGASAAAGSVQADGTCPATGCMFVHG
jgi:hypothetical protein